LTPSISPPALVDHQSIHYAAIYPVKRTPCGKLGPASSEIRYVTCSGCREKLGAGPKA
jgi:hypothetical protein